ncbi:DUF2634 domain-containing protein [Lacrimispora algidixylanolytica]|uniref:DUF2634 domain-containing protein n=1 Tax=Lacrimispora algidixylanolytica TaxID=94868 RepID=A0A419T6M5_9FIRM|nr:DUF2634 domain-containing protein [Lacrimispora algidixylanolytica]RKD33082.1 hypothetical protein BET01_15830 [Lacrimispora algidixylanolytica]
MATLPNSANTVIYEKENREYPTETYLVDKSTGTIKKVGGGLEAMKQAIEIILETERYQNQIYTSNFGRELKKLIGKPPEYVTSMLKRRIQEAFSSDKRILSVNDFLFDASDLGTLRCTFKVKTVYGTIPGEVEI